MNIILLFALLGVIAPLATLLALILWKGVWRWLACVPPVLMALYCVKIAVDFALDTTSHNLLPFELLFFYGLATPYFAAITVLRWLVRRWQRRDRGQGSSRPQASSETAMQK